jgi:hypothetical protein
MSTKKKSPRQPQFRNSADFNSLYVNFMQTAASPMDISIGVGETSPTETGVVDVEMKARLVMAPLQAKVMVTMLVHAIKQFEAQFGEIAIPAALSMGQVADLKEGEHSTEGD